MSGLTQLAFAERLHNNHPNIYAALRVPYEWLQHILSLKYYIFRLFPIQNNKIVLTHYFGKSYADNPKYIVEEFLQRGGNYKLIWLQQKNNQLNSEIPQNIKIIRYGSFSMVYHMVTAKFWVDDFRKFRDVRKRHKQYYIQTWHGFGPKGMPIFTHSQLKSCKRDSDLTDIYVSCSALLSKFYRELFYYSGKILEIGYPRYDILSNNNVDRVSVCKKVCMSLSIPEKTRIVLFAPTYRQDFSLNSFTMCLNMIINACVNRFGEKWIMLYRLHPLIAKLSKNIDIDNKSVFDATDYLDMQELLLVADVLITDYSSCMFDFAVTRKPCFLYHPDENEYDDTRGFCISPEDLPFPCAHTNEELQCLIETFDETEYRKTLDAYLEKIGFIEDGNASKAVVDWIEKKIKEDS